MCLPTSPLKEYKVKRSLDPIFSYAIKGKLKKKLLRSKVEVCFGEQSIFKKIEDYNFKIFGFCCPLNTMSFIHYIEKKMGVKYRFSKIFVSTFIRDNKKQKIKLEYFVGKKNIDYKLKFLLVERVLILPFYMNCKYQWFQWLLLLLLGCQYAQPYLYWQNSR